jgi:hypothetical protein
MGSPRRTTGDINILAMLDGQAPGRRLRAVPAAFWYGAAGVFACSLLATLAWLVRDGASAPDAGRDGAAQASLHHDAADRAPAAPAVPLDTAARGAGATAARDAHAAGAQDAVLIVTQLDGNPESRDGVPVTLPGMRTVPAAGASAVQVSAAEASAAQVSAAQVSAAGASAPATAPPPVPVPASPAIPGHAAASGLSATAPAHGAVIVDLPQPAQAAVPPLTESATAGGVPAHAATGMAAAHAQPAAGRPAPTRTAQTAPPARTQTGSRPVPARAPSLAHTEPTPTPTRQKRGSAAPRPASPAAVDTDVAVISAILQHTGARNEATDTARTAACTDRPCATHMPSRQ